MPEAPGEAPRDAFYMFFLFFGGGGAGTLFFHFQKVTGASDVRNIEEMLKISTF